MKNFKIIFLTLILILLTNIPTQAMLSSDNIGTTTAQFLKLGIGAKSAGMGNAVTSVENGIDSIYWNPANLNFINKMEFSFSHAIWFEDVNYEWLSFVLPTSRYGTFGIGLQYVSYGDIERVDNTNTSDGSFSPLDMALYLSYANMYERLMFGFNLKYIYSKIENSASAFALDLGLNYKFENNKTSIGGAITNIGTDMKFNDVSEPLPLLFKIGASHLILDNWLVSLDVNFPNDNDLYVNIGTQYNVEVTDDIDCLFRVGYEGRNKDIPGFNWINLGFGLRYSDYIFDYAFVPYGDIGMTHRFSLSIKFGQVVEKQKKQKYTELTNIKISEPQSNLDKPKTQVQTEQQIQREIAQARLEAYKAQRQASKAKLEAEQVQAQADKARLEAEQTQAQANRAKLEAEQAEADALAKEAKLKAQEAKIARAKATRKITNRRKVDNTNISPRR